MKERPGKRTKKHIINYTNLTVTAINDSGRESIVRNATRMKWLPHSIYSVLLFLRAVKGNWAYNML